MSRIEETLFKKIIHSRVYQAAERTPLEKAELISAECGNAVYMKREDKQSVFSFKIRGAYNAIRQLSDTQLRSGIVCASAGNHAQGVAKSARIMGATAHIVMPVYTSKIKIDAVKKLGGIVHLAGQNFAETEAAAQRMAKEQKRTFIHPFDDAEVIAGQGTIGMEIYQDLEHIDYVFVPIGGGGLISGIAVFLKTVCPSIRIIGVEHENSNSMQVSLAAKRRITLKHTGTFAEGVAVPKVGKMAFSICRKLLDDIIITDSEKICSAIRRIYYETRVLPEPSGAISMAGALAYIKEHGLQDKNIVTINCGANMNFDTLRFVSHNLQLEEGKEILLGIEIPENAGTLQNLCNHLMQSRQITEFIYCYHDPKVAKIFLGIQPHRPSEKEEVLGILEQLGYPTCDLTDDPLSKFHIRRMVGGHSPHRINEHVFSFVFPEKPDALYMFLHAMKIPWNISLFHYVNDGSSYSRVFMGVQTEKSDTAKVTQFFRAKGFSFEEQTENVSYRMFLR